MCVWVWVLSQWSLFRRMAPLYNHHLPLVTQDGALHPLLCDCFFFKCWHIDELMCVLGEYIHVYTCIHTHNASSQDNSQGCFSLSTVWVSGIELRLLGLEAVLLLLSHLVLEYLSLPPPLFFSFLRCRGLNLGLMSDCPNLYWCPSYCEFISVRAFHSTAPHLGSRALPPPLLPRCFLSLGMWGWCKCPI